MRTPGGQGVSKWAGVVLTAISVLGIAAATLSPQPDGGDSSPLCIICGSLGLRDAILNVILFIPLGIGLRLLGLSTRAAIATVAALTLAIELAQVRLVRGRDASLGDLLTNVTGGGLGAWLCSRWRTLVHARDAGARRLALAATVAFVALQSLSGWALHLSLPASLEYWGNWPAGVADGSDVDAGPPRVLINGVALPFGRNPATAALRRELLRDTMRFEALLPWTGFGPGFAPIAGIGAEDARDEQVDIAQLSRAGDDLYFQVRMRASDARLPSPTIRLEGAFRAPADRDGQALAEETVAVHGGIVDRRLYAAARIGGAELQRHDVPLTPSLGWTFVAPAGGELGPGYRIPTALWLAALLLPIGYWSARSGPRGADGGTPGARVESRPGERVASMLVPAFAIVAGLGVVSLAFGLGGPAAWEWIAATIGAGAGYLLGRRAG